MGREPVSGDRAAREPVSERRPSRLVNCCRVCVGYRVCLFPRIDFRIVSNPSGEYVGFCPKL